MTQSPRAPVFRNGLPARFAVLLLAGGAGLILAGCAVAGPSGTGHSATGTAGRPSASSASSASPTSSASLTPGQRAQADAAAILAAFAMPPGAKRLPAPPASVKAALGRPFQTDSSPDIADKDSFWTVPGVPAAVLAWEEQHVPRRFTHAETFHGTDGSAARSGDVFTLPPIAGVLESRELMVEVADGGGGQTAIRVDAQVTWTPAKPAGAVVPAAARAVTLSMNYGGNADGRKPPAPVTITDPVTVGDLAALVDHVPPLPSGSYNCPFADGMAFDLSFRARPGGPAIAFAVLQLNGCEWVDLTVGKQDYSLGNPAGARSLATQVLKVAGVPWNLPPFQWSS
ncbi:MAG: hypothetical protein ACRDP7_25710 [Trebonia sp.]